MTQTRRAVRPRIGIVRFPGTNCEFDVAAALQDCGADPFLLDHRAQDTSDADGIVLPGGFAYGDYLRAGAIARLAPVMAAVERFAARAGPVVGICNGFQVLTEAGLLPGALVRNAGMKFVCKPTTVRMQAVRHVMAHGLAAGEQFALPVNHFEGSYACDAPTLTELRRADRIVLRYADNPNGSVDDIAGICNAERNVVGLMPHPERAMSALLGGADGARLLSAFVTSAAEFAEQSP